MVEIKTHNYSTELSTKNSKLIDHKSVEPGAKSPELTDKQKQIREKLLSVLDELKESFQTYGSDFFETKFERGEQNNIEYLESFLKTENSEDLKSVLNFQNENGMTILHDVADFHHEMTKLLLNAGANPDLPDKDGKTPLRVAMDYRCYGAVSLFFDDKLKRLSEKQKELNKELHELLDDINYVSTKKRFDPEYKVESDKIAALKKFLDYHKKENSEDLKIVLNLPSGEFGSTILHNTQSLFYTETLNLFSGAGADLDVQDIEGKTPLDSAADFNCTEIVKMLLNGGAKPNIQDKDGCTPLHSAVSSNACDSALAIIEAGADLDVKDIEGKTPLHYAADFNCTEIVKMLLKGGVKPNIQDKDGCTPLHSAVNSNACDSALAIIEAGADLDVPDGNGQFPLHIAAQYDYEHIAKLLLDNGAKYNIKDKEGNTPIYYATRQGFMGIVECLMEKDDIELDTLHVYQYTPEYGILKESPLHSAVALSIKSGRIAELLLRKESIDANIDDESGNTPLLIAAGSGRNSTVDLLIEKGANVHSVNKKGNSVFHFAAANDYIDKFSMPSSSGKSKNDIASVGWLYDAEQADNTRSVVDLNPCMIINTIIRHIIEEEKKKGSDINQIKQAILDIINSRNQDGNTTLFFAVERGNHDVITKLLEEGAKVAVIDQNGYTPYHYAVKNKDPEILKLLSITPLECGEIVNHIQHALMQNNSQEFNNLDNFVKQYNCLDTATYIIEKVLPSISHKDNNKEFIGNIIDTIFPNYMKDDRESYEAIKTNVSKIIESVVKITNTRLSVLDKEENTLLHHAVKWGCGEEILDFLVRRGVDINAKNKHGVAPIHIAAKYGKASQMEFFIRNKADLNVQCGNFTKAETEILEENFVTVQDGNMDANSIVSVKNEASYENATPTFIAADNLNADAVHMLISEKVNPNVPSSIGATPLHVVIARILNKDYEEQEKGEVYGIFQKLVLSSTNDPLRCKKFIEVLDGDKQEKEKLKKAIDTIIEDSKTPTAPVEESAPLPGKNFYHEVGSHVKEAPDLHLDYARSKAMERSGGDYGVEIWNLAGDHPEQQYQREVTAEQIADDEWSKANIRTGNERAEIYDIEKSEWKDESDDKEKKDVDDSTSGWHSAPQKEIKSWIDRDNREVYINQLGLLSKQANDAETTPNEKPISAKQNAEPTTDINSKEPSTILPDSSIQEVNVEKRIHPGWAKLIKRDELKLNKFLDLVSKAQNMVELNKIVDQALKAGIRINYAQDNNYTFANVALLKASQLKLDPTIASGIVCKLVSKGAVFGKNYDKINDELNKSGIFEDHKINLQKATKEFSKHINEFQRIVGSAVVQDELKNLETDNTTFFIECSPDSIVDVAKLINGAKSLVESGGGIVKIGQNTLKIEKNNGITNYSNLLGNGRVVLTLKGLEITLYCDTQNKDRMIVEVNDNDMEMINGLSDEAKKEMLGKYLLEGIPLCKAIEQGYCGKSGKLPFSETISLPGKIMKEASEIIKSLEDSGCNIDTPTNWVNKTRTESGKGAAVVKG